ncbi:M20/M25/M40 family metallo-hydrolase [Janthinobacterium psychrotolerans]|uniref:Carboxypeptidase Q n=1 Tax=Janthinobacterium psychrotolerans TaxID=1747903 RepID=A0A1A7BXV5_9BURK|nr:M20/M25/M40 family metallo-hydrolase [Janthinobacterium psychrotolerans]OBV38342.1 Zn-dependent amino- or carboxypeptidase, M28 family [Janthinobacterium psychrotolerans]
MPSVILRHTLVSVLLGSVVSTSALAAAPGNDTAALAQVRDTALQSDWAYARLTDLTDLIGPRLSGSAGAAAAVEQVAATMRGLGAKVTLQPVKVPHWVRGVETAAIVDYAGRPHGVSQRVVLTALGGSGATPAAGLTAPLIIVRSFEELTARAAEVKGAIVLIDTAFDQEMAERGLAGATYGQGSRFRFNGPRAAAELGAAAALVRSIGGADFRIPHAGATGLEDGQRIPAAAVTVEDALLIGRLAARGPMKMHLTLTPQNLPEADSYNVIADWPGTDKADEVVIVSGHLDSWDLATGAHDDGAGVVAAMGVIETLKKLDYRPRRTIRVIAWMNEENGGRGGQAYFEANKQALGKQYAAIEMDMGAGRPFGILASVGSKSEKLFAPLRAALQPIGAHAFTRRDVLGSGDLHRLEKGGVPSFEPLVDSHNYFHYHHTPADTLDKVDPANLQRNVALMSSLAWYLANLDGEIGRAPEQE